MAASRETENQTWTGKNGAGIGWKADRDAESQQRQSATRGAGRGEKGGRSGDRRGKRMGREAESANYLRFPATGAN